MAMAAPSLNSFGGQNVMLMRSDMGSSNSLVAMLSSCNPHHVGFQVPRSGGGLEDAIAGCGGKRGYYPTFVDGGPMEEAEDDADGDADLTHPVEKKRRLSFDQVRSLERNFEMENKLEPERKMQLAKDLGLQPRQVAVWFQNRRARWKTKQLERDYETLNSGYLQLKADFEAALREKDALKAKVQRLSGKASSQDSQSDVADSSQCVSEAHCGVTESTPHQASTKVPTSSGEPAPAAVQSKELSKEDVKDQNTTTTSSDGSNDESSSELLDADSPRTTSDSNHLSARVGEVGDDHQDPNHLVSSYCAHFAPESFVGPGDLAFPVKLEDHGQFQVDPSCSYFLPPMVEQGVLPWWDWA